MSKEIEGRILNINKEEMNKTLISLGAKKVGEYDFKRFVFDTIPEQKGRWVRLRTDGQKSTLTVKEIIKDNSVDGTEEWEVGVSDFNKTLIILEKIGIKPRSYQESRRTEYEFMEAKLSIDTWPIIGTLLEIEAPEESIIHSILSKLGFSSKDLDVSGIDAIYQKNGIDLSKVKNLTFKKSS